MPTPYVKQTWIDGVAGATPISAARLTYIEDGIENATVEDGTYVGVGDLVLFAGNYVPSGATRSVSHINLAITAANARGGGTVLVDEGEWVHNASLTMKSNVHVTGWPGTILKTADGDTNAYLGIVNVNAENGLAFDYNMRVSNLTLDLNGDTRPGVSAAGIRFKAGFRSLTGNITSASDIITNLSAAVTNLDMGATVGAGGGAAGIPLGATITEILSTTSVRISANATATTAGIALLFEPNGRCYGVEVDHVTVKNIPGTAIAIQLMSVNDFHIHHNRIDNIGRDGISAWFNSYSGSIDHNILTQIGDDCIALNSEVTGHAPGTQCRDIKIHDNIGTQRTDTTFGSGIGVRGALRTNVRDNTILRAVGSGITVDGGYISGAALPSTKTDLSGNHVVFAGTAATGGHGISVTANTRKTTISGGSIEGYYGSAVLAAARVSVSGVDIGAGQVSTSSGVVVSAGHGSTVKGNTFTGTNHYMVRIAAESCVVSGNTGIDCNTANAAATWIAIFGNKNTVQANTLRRSGTGFGFVGVNLTAGFGENVVSHNVITGFAADAGVRDESGLLTNKIDLNVGSGDRVITARKTADQAVVDAVQVDLAGLAFAIAANEVRAFDAMVIYDSSTANDARFTLSAPAGATYQFGVLGLATSATSIVGSVGPSIGQSAGATNGAGGTRGAGVAATRGFALVRGIITNGATAGTVQLRGSKLANTDATTPADDLTVYSGSHLTATRQ